jgi:adenylate cyclase
MITIGRTPPNEVVIPHPKISRNHAIIRMLEVGEYYLVDVGSTNGTFLNGKRVVTPARLKDRDVITVEDCTLTFLDEHVPVRCADPEDDGMLTLTMTSLDIEMVEITLFICDIRNYTPMSECLPPNELASLMARWFKMATKVIEECSGTIDKFIGDAIMVRWTTGVGKNARASVLNALTVAKRLNEVCVQVNATNTRLPYPFKVGVGINTGRAVLGSIGGSGYREYTAIGDAVNMAFRFESESKKLGKDVVIGEDSFKLLQQKLWDSSLRSVTVKGKSEPVSVWAITFDEIDAILAASE